MEISIKPTFGIAAALPTVAAVYDRRRSERRNPMSFVLIMAIGLIVGTLAEFLMPKGHPGGRRGTVILGVGGALLAGILGWSEHWYALNQPGSFIASAVGAIVLLAIYRLTIPEKRIEHREKRIEHGDFRKAA